MTNVKKDVYKRQVYTYDNYGNQTLKTSGKQISITGNKIETVSYDSDGRAVTGYDLSSVITITIDVYKRQFLYCTHDFT